MLTRKVLITGMGTGVIEKCKENLETFHITITDKAFAEDTGRKTLRINKRNPHWKTVSAQAEKLLDKEAYIAVERLEDSEGNGTWEVSNITEKR